MKAIPILLLCGSNLFMTAAWYGHLKYKGAALWLVVLVSWCIALPEYALQVPANRIGHGMYTAPQLKIIQEAISVAVFVGFSLWYLKETPRWTDIGGFLLIFAGLALALLGRSPGTGAA
ncbi:MAG: DMT family protein [Planctomycetota bacterium]